MSEATYCTLTDVYNRLSREGVDLRLDDAPPDVDADVLDDAASIIEEFCRVQYAPAQLSASRWVNQRCTDIASYLLCERRGNPVPKSIERSWRQYVDNDGRPGRLDLVRKGSLQIPDIPMRKEMVPRVSTMRTRLDPVGPRAVVEKYRSTGTAEGYKQRTDSTEVFTDYSI